jgi:hypothetical protein
MSLSKATGTNSVVLKMKAARASATTLSQLPGREHCDSFMLMNVWKANGSPGTPGRRAAAWRLSGVKENGLA